MNIGYIPSSGTSRNRSRQQLARSPPDSDQLRWSDPDTHQRATPPKLNRTDEVLAALERGCEKLKKYERMPNETKRKWKGRSMDENAKLLSGRAQQNGMFYSPPLTPPNDDDQQNPMIGSNDGILSTNWCAIYLSAFLTFCSAIQFSIYYASLWPYYQKLDQNATEDFFGYIVAIYSLGNILGFMVFGFMSSRTNRIRFLLYGCFLLMFAGNGLYLMLSSFSARKRKYILCIARFITGIGSSNFTLLKAYASASSAENDRSKAIALVACGAAFGLSVGPVVQALFVPLGHLGIKLYLLPKFPISMYTAPALFASVLNVLNMICVKKFIAEKSVELYRTGDTVAKNGQLPKYDRTAVLLCYVTRFTQMFVYTTLETIGTALAMMMFSWHRTDAVLYASVAQSLMFLLDFLIYIFYLVFRIDKMLNLRVTLICALLGLGTFYSLTYPSYSFWPGHVRTFSGSDLKNHSEPIGCDRDRFNWCPTVRPLPPLYFYFCYVLAIGLAFPNINIALNTLFLRILGPRPHGAQDGILQMSGLMARMVGPVVISSLYTSYGPKEVWLVALEVIGATLLFWLLIYRRMVPLAMPRDILMENPFEEQKMPKFNKMKKSVKIDARKPKLITTISEEEDANL